MATIGTSWTNIASTVWDFGNTKITYYLDAILISQDTVNNKSYFKTKLRSVLHYGWANSQNYTFTCSYAPTVSGTNSWYSATEDITVSSSNQEISHNSDGTKSITLTARAYMSGVGDTTFSGTCTFPTIPRASKLNSASMSIANNGNSITVTPNITKYVSSYYDVLTIKNGTTTVATLDGVTHNTAKSLTSAQITAVYNAIGTATTKTLTCYVTTYTNSSKTTSLGNSSSVNLTATLPNYSITINGTMEDTVTTYNTYKPSGHTNDTFIRYLSKPKFALTSSSSTGSYYGRSISYKLGSTTISNPYTENNYTGQSFSFTATDGRKTSSAYTPSPTVIQYFEPTLNVSVSRTTPTGSTIDISISGTYYSGTGLTNLVTPSVALVYTESGGSQVSTTIPITTTTSGNIVSFTGTKQLTGMNYQKSVQWAITLTDIINRTNTKSGTVTQGLPVWNGYRKNDTNYFNVNGNANITGETIVNKISSKNMFNYIYISNGKRIASDGSPYNESGYFLSDYISIEPSTTYTISRANLPSSSMNCYALYDSSKNFILRSSFYTTTNVTFTSSSNAKYIRITDTNNNLSSLQIEKGGTASAYSNYQDFDNFKYERMTPDSFITLSNGFSFGETSIYRHKNHYTGTITIKKSSKFGGGGVQEQIGVINSNLGALPYPINTFGVSGATNNDVWAIPDNFAYIYIGNAQNQILLKGKNTDSYVKFNIDVILD